jgi:hypothetical protein
MPTKPPAARSEVTYRQSASARVCRIDHGKSERVEGSRSTLLLGGALIARIFVQEETGKKRRSLPGDAISHFVPAGSVKMPRRLQVLPNRLGFISPGQGRGRNVCPIGRGQFGFRILGGSRTWLTANKGSRKQHHGG